jgi:hypothetical protein
VTLTEFFAYLEAPLANQRWSWGAVRPSDGAVLLRVWQDEQRKMDGPWLTQVTFTEFSKTLRVAAMPSDWGMSN